MGNNKEKAITKMSMKLREVFLLYGKKNTG